MRHGETDWNAAGRVQGHDDRARLTPRGEHQVDRVAALLAGLDVECVYSSDLGRAQQTASVIAATTGAVVVTDRRLRERGFGRLEGAPTTSLGPAVTGILDGRITDIRSHPVGGESLEQLYRRCQSFVSLLHSLGEGRDIVVVAHGGSIRMLRAAWAGTGPEHLAWAPVGNAALFRLVLPLSPPDGDDIGPVLSVSRPAPSSEPPQSSVTTPSSAGSPAAMRPPSTVGRPS
jgi:2,3-bisphosphoglycerate-dependent phosphoglycerate mutase